MGGYSEVRGSDTTHWWKLFTGERAKERTGGMLSIGERVGECRGGRLLKGEGLRYNTGWISFRGEVLTHHGVDSIQR